MGDTINHPPHYTFGSLEAIDAMEAMLTPEEFIGFYRGTIQKYLWRAGHKGSALEDFQKAKWYLDRLIEHLKKVTKEPRIAACPGHDWLLGTWEEQGFFRCINCGKIIWEGIPEFEAIWKEKEYSPRNKAELSDCIHWSGAECEMENHVCPCKEYDRRATS